MRSSSETTMKKYAFILVLTPFILHGCDFFYSTVEYKGREAEPRLCVTSHVEANSSLARVDVLHSEFFLNAAKDSLPVLRDALVTLQRNNDAPVSLTYVPGHDTVTSYSENGWSVRKFPLGHYEAPISFFESDTVRLHVEHPDYGSVDAIQVCPMMPFAELTIDSVSVYNEVYCRLSLPPYRRFGRGDLTDVLMLTATVGAGKTVYYSMNPAYMYSRDPALTTYQKYQTTTGYYGGIALFLPVSDQPREIQLVLDHYTSYSDEPLPYDEYDDDTDVEDEQKLSVNINLQSHTLDSYRYMYTLSRTLDSPFSNYMPDLTSESTMRGDDVPDINIAEIFNIISEEFSVLGNAEGYQVYSNLTGKNKRNLQPFGCFRMSNWYLVSQTVPLPANN